MRPNLLEQNRNASKSVAQGDGKTFYDLHRGSMVPASASSNCASFIHRSGHGPALEIRVQTETDRNRWVEKFMQRSDVIDVLQQVDHVVPADTGNRTAVLHGLRNELLNACYHAAAFDLENDQRSLFRQESTSFRRKRISAEKHARALKSFLAAHPRVANDIGARTMQTLRDKGVLFIGARDAAAYLGLFSGALVAALGATDIDKEMRMPGLIENTAHGCILFPAKIVGNRLPEVQTMLAFNLVFLFRKASVGEMLVQLGEPMPQNGTPHYALVAQLIEAALDIGNGLDARGVKELLAKFLQRNSGVCLIRWGTKQEK